MLDISGLPLPQTTAIRDFLALKETWDPDGWSFGGYAGANWQYTKNIVLGIDANLALGGASGSGPLLFPSGGIVSGQSFDSDVNWTGSARLRVGYAVDRFLPYIAGGVSAAQYSVNNTVSGITESGLDGTLVGWTLGGGVDYAVTDNLIARIEYRYSDFGRERANPDTFDSFDVDLETQEVRLGLAYKF